MATNRHEVERVSAISNHIYQLDLYNANLNLVMFDK